jgi:hypothetical protein
MNMKTTISILIVAQMLAPAFATSRSSVFLKATTKPQARASATTPKCQTIGGSELTITCAYTAASPVDADERFVPRVILNRAAISLIPSDGNPMRVELTFTNGTSRKIADHRTVYLSIDDQKGQNKMRRALPHVEFAKLEPGRSTKFEETLLAPAFSAGTYIVSIWIPSTDPSLKFNPAHNFLLSSKGVPDWVAGVNRIAEFTVTPSDESTSRAGQANRGNASP